MTGYMRAEYLLYLFPYFFLGFITYFQKPWFIYFPENYVYILSALFVPVQILTIYLYKKDFLSGIQKYISNPIIIILTGLISFISMLLFPVRNLKLGDGILLLETVEIESGILGFHLTMDEIFEAMIHSLPYSVFRSSFSGPDEIYRIISSIAGFIFITILIAVFIKKKYSLSSLLLVLSSGGLLLFYGYSENYSITTLFEFIYLLTGYSLLQSDRKNMSALVPICILASVLILLHLVSGYIIFSLVYYCYIVSDRDKFWRNAVLSFLLCMFITLPFFVYFFKISDLIRFDLTQTHATSPVFYPYRKIISTIHFRDFIYCGLANSFASVFIFIYFFIVRKNSFLDFLKRKEVLFSGLVLFGFIIHGFFYFPQLGFPADWDLLGFYWLPLTMIVIVYFNQIERNGVFIPLILFSLLIHILNFTHLTVRDEKDEVKYREALQIAGKFIELNKDDVHKTAPEYKKFYLKVSYFLFKSELRLGKVNTPEAEEFSKQIPAFKKELSEHRNDIPKAWQKDYYNRLTVFHKDLLKIVE